MKTLKLNSVQTKNDVTTRLFGIDLHEVITEIYTSLLDDNNFCAMLDQTLNSRDDLYREYIDRVNKLVDGLIDPDNETHPMTLYNLLTSDDRFYKAWTDELFNYIYVGVRLYSEDLS